MRSGLLHSKPACGEAEGGKVLLLWEFQPAVWDTQSEDERGRCAAWSVQRSRGACSATDHLHCLPLSADLHQSSTPRRVDWQRYDSTMLLRHRSHRHSGPRIRHKVLRHALSVPT
jgi:hypothetical protein